MIREVMSSFSGNELVIGLVLGVWLLATGIGSLLGTLLTSRVRVEQALLLGHIFLALMPFGQVAAIRGFPLLWVRGELVGLTSAVVCSALILVPFCLVSGAMIPLAGALLEGKGTTRKVYIVDTIGDICGGLLFSLVFVYALSHWDSLVVLGFLNLVAASVMTSWALWPLLALFGLSIVAIRPLHLETLSWRFPGQDLLLHKNTPFAQLTISKTGQQLNVLQDAIPLFSSHDLDMEALAHIPLCQISQGANILLISGGVFGTLEEMAKHEPHHIDYVELDPAILALDEFVNGGLSPPFVQVHVGDGRLFIKQNTAQYDAVIVDLPDPENTQLNRFYTQEFFDETKAVLKHRGVLCFTLVGADNYLEEKGLAVNRAVYAALQRTFNYVLVLPGMTHYYLASDTPLTRDIATILGKRSIQTTRLVDYDLSSMADPFRIDRLRGLLEEGRTLPNQDLSPRAFGHLLDLWLKKSGSPKGLLTALSILILIFAVWACRHSSLQFTILTSGYAGMAFELSLLLLFQVIYGYVYLRMCAFITLFMIGSALGALVSVWVKKDPFLQILAWDAGLMVLAAFSCGGAVVGIGVQSHAWLFAMQYVIIPSLIFLVACGAGWQFSVVSRVSRGMETEITGRLYLADLAGAACGTILTGLLFLPKLGIVGVLVSVLTVKGLSLTVNVVSRNRAQ
jgi:spermidine synthase